MTARIRATGKPLNGSTFREMSRKMQDIYLYELTQAAKEGQAEAKAYIGIAGTQQMWHGKFKGRDHPNRGRYDTHTMQNAVNYRVQKGGQNLRVDVGWISPNTPEYFLAQDTGFFAGGFRPAMTVEGMHMLAHLRYYMRDRVDLALDRAGKRTFNAL